LAIRIWDDSKWEQVILPQMLKNISHTRFGNEEVQQDNGDEDKDEDLDQ